MKAVIGVIAAAVAFTSVSSFAREPLAVEVLGRNAVSPVTANYAAKGLTLVAKTQTSKGHNVANVMGRGAPVLYSAAPQVTMKPLNTAKLVSNIQGRA